MSIEDILRAELTDEQRAAATDTAKEILCLACAGSGKSRTLAYRIARLLAEGAAPDSIVAFTFTDKAAETIKRRVSQSLAKAGISQNLMGAMYIGTIHSYCQHVLGIMDATYRQFEVLDENRLKLYLISRFYDLGLISLRPRARGGSYFDTIRQVSDAWKTLHDEILDLQQVVLDDPELGDALSRLNERLHRDQFIDFSLMIRKVVDALERGDASVRAAIRPLKHLMVDEYQDVSPAQKELIRKLHELADSLFVVGDDDQSIYAWRGADVSNILTFQERYPSASRHTLSDNFRSTPAIVEASNSFAAAELGPSRITKSPRAVNNRSPHDSRVLWFSNRAEEANWVAERIRALLGMTYFEESDGSLRGLTPADFAILMRSTREPEQDGAPRHSAFTRALSGRNIQFSLEAGGGPFERSQVNVLRLTFGLLRNGSPTREEAKRHFDTQIIQAYPAADFDAMTRVLTEWGRLIHTPAGGARRRVYPQVLVYDLLEAFGLSRAPIAPVVMREIGLFSRMIQDVEAVYMSVDSVGRFREIVNFLDNAAETGYDVSTYDVMQRPDAVTVSTVHKMKGLEFPVVFVVDVESQRFPGRRMGYQGWLPAVVMQPALDRGAYQRTDNEEARLFYTAVTRAERYLYVTGAANLPHGRRARQTSRFANRLQHPDILQDPEGLPQGLQPGVPRRRIDESILPTSFSDIRYYLLCPMAYRFRQGFGFSPPIPDMFGFGKTVHTVIEKLHERYEHNSPTDDEAAAVANSIFHLKHVPVSRDPEHHPGPYERARDKAVEIAKKYASTYESDFQRRRQVEARFEISARDCVITGAIDLLLKEDERGNILEAEVIDFKAIEGGEIPTENADLDWTELSIQVQLYAKAAREVFGENAQTGSVHLLKDDHRVNVPISDAAIDSAMKNLEWAVQGILTSDYPMRPHPAKCGKCDFNRICAKVPQDFQYASTLPPKVHLPNGQEYIRSFSLFNHDT
jgi:DNA helicase-2/ATP-dependent DNA helicase PcrA